MDEKPKNQCICPECPSFIDCEEPTEYCLPEISISKCISKEKGCICPECPFYEKRKLDRKYYCIR